jgi:hypothetical protein
MAISTDPDYRYQALHAFQSQREGYRLALHLQAEYGKWLIATIAGIHLAAIYLVISNDSLPPSAKINGTGVFAAGIMNILFAGLFALWNSRLLARLYGEWSDARILVDPEAWPKEDPFLTRRIEESFNAAVMFGAISAALIFVGTVVVISSL